MLSIALLLLSGLQAAEAGADVEVRVVLLDAPRETPFLGGLRASLVFDDPSGPSRTLPLSLEIPRGFERLDAVAPRQIRPVEGTPWRAGLRALPLPTAARLGARSELVAGPYFRARLRTDEIPPGSAVSVRFELPDGVAWAHGFSLRPEPADFEPAGISR